jgi:CBS domain-containing protein
VALFGGAAEKEAIGMATDKELDRAHALDGVLGTVAAAMRAEVVLVDPDTPADVAARRLERARISGAPVVPHAHVVGVVTLRDLFAAGAPTRPRRRRRRFFAMRVSSPGTGSPS